MALKALERKTRGLTELQEKYLDIIIHDYGGYVPYGEKTKIAERLGCTVAYLSSLDSGASQPFIKEKRRRVREVIPMADDLMQIAALQNLYDSAVTARKNQAVPLTDRDPVDIIDVMRKVSQTPTKREPTQNIQATQFNFSEMDSESLSKAIQLIEKVLRGGGLEELGSVVDGNFEVVETE